MSAEYLTLRDVASTLGVSVHSVRYWVRVGALPSVRPRRLRLVRKADLAIFLTQNERGQLDGSKEGAA